MVYSNMGMKGGISTEKYLRSFLLEHFPESLRVKLDLLGRYRNLQNDAMEEKLFGYFREYGIDATPLGMGTNRYGFKLRSFAIKFATNEDGRIDNLKEFKMSPLLQPHVIKVHEVSENGSLLVTEYVQPFESFYEMQRYQSRILTILRSWSDVYLIGDVGISDLNYANWGIQPGTDELVCLDFAYIYDVNSELFLCSEPRCRGRVMLVPDANFTDLVCPNCGTKHMFRDIRLKIGKEDHLREIGDLTEEGYLLSDSNVQVTLDSVRSPYLSIPRTGRSPRGSPQPKQRSDEDVGGATYDELTITQGGSNVDGKNSPSGWKTLVDIYGNVHQLTKPSSSGTGDQSSGWKTLVDIYGNVHQLVQPQTNPRKEPESNVQTQPTVAKPFGSVDLGKLIPGKPIPQKSKSEPPMTDFVAQLPSKPKSTVNKGQSKVPFSAKLQPAVDDMAPVIAMVTPEEKSNLIECLAPGDSAINADGGSTIVTEIHTLSYEDPLSRLPSTKEVQPAVQKLSKNISQSLLTAGILSEAIRYLRPGLNLTEEALSSKVWDAIYFSWLNFLGIPRKKGTEPYNPQLTWSTPYLGTWAFIDKAYHDIRVSKKSDPTEKINAYRFHYGGERVGISLDLCPELLARLNGLKILEPAGCEIIMDAIANLWCDDGSDPRNRTPAPLPPSPEVTPVVEVSQVVAVEPPAAAIAKVIIEPRIIDVDITSCPDTDRDIIRVAEYLEHIECPHCKYAFSPSVDATGRSVMIYEDLRNVNPDKHNPDKINGYMHWLRDTEPRYQIIVSDWKPWIRLNYHNDTMKAILMYDGGSDRLNPITGEKLGPVVGIYYLKEGLLDEDGEEGLLIRQLDMMFTHYIQGTPLSQLDRSLSNASLYVTAEKEMELMAKLKENVKAAEIVESELENVTDPVEVIPVEEPPKPPPKKSNGKSKKTKKEELPPEEVTKEVTDEIVPDPRITEVAKEIEEIVGTISDTSEPEEVIETIDLAKVAQEVANDFSRSNKERDATKQEIREETKYGDTDDDLRNFSPRRKGKR